MRRTALEGLGDMGLSGMVRDASKSSCWYCAICSGVRCTSNMVGNLYLKLKIFNLAGERCAPRFYRFQLGAVDRLDLQYLWPVPPSLYQSNPVQAAERSKFCVIQLILVGLCILSAFMVQ